MYVLLVDSSDEYFSKTTSSMEASAIAALEWACVTDWRLRPSHSKDWITWMYERVEELTIIVREQRVEWHAKATEEHPDVLSLNSERKRFFQEFLLTGSITAKSIAQAQCEDEVCLFDDSTTSTTSKKPRLFKDGIL